MVNIDVFFAQPARHTAIWEGPQTPEAEEWAAKHNLSYVRFFGPPPHILIQKHGLGGGVTYQSPGTYFNEPLLKAANEAYNKEVREQHEADQELDTGTGILEIKTTKWFQATRGQKLRTLKVQRRFYGNEIAITNQRKEKTIRELKSAGRIGDGNNEMKHRASERLREVMGDIASYLTILDIVNRVENMVLGELEEGWDWKKGLREQLDERNVLYGLTRELSEEAMKTFNVNSKKINCY